MLHNIYEFMITFSEQSPSPPNQARRAVRALQNHFPRGRMNFKVDYVLIKFLNVRQRHLSLEWQVKQGASHVIFYYNSVIEKSSFFSHLLRLDSSCFSKPLTTSGYMSTYIHFQVTISEFLSQASASCFVSSKILFIPTFPAILLLEHIQLALLLTCLKAHKTTWGKDLKRVKYEVKGNSEGQEGNGSEVTNKVPSSQSRTEEEKWDSCNKLSEICCMTKQKLG